MKLSQSARFSLFVSCLFALMVFIVPRTLRAQQNWHATVGAESPDMGKQALAFLPNEIWIHAGDSITWTFQSDEVHTLTFLTPGQITPSDFTLGCPGFASSGAAFDGSTCVTTPPMVKGQTFAVAFPKAGNYKFDCLVHNTMTGAIHVLNASETLPHSQGFYDDQAAAQRKALLTDTDQKMQMAMNHDGDHDGDDGFSVQVIHKKHVTAGVGEMTSNAGGTQQLAIVRFLDATITIHVGDTVEWTNNDPDEPHTITFGPDPTGNPFAPSSNVTVDSDGALHAILTSPSENVHSGALLQALEDEGGSPQNTLVNNPTRFRATFTQPGTYNYHCFFHDNLGMVGKVIVLP
jgi:plastocyanin